MDEVQCQIGINAKPYKFRSQLSGPWKVKWPDAICDTFRTPHFANKYY